MLARDRGPLNAAQYLFHLNCRIYRKMGYDWNGLVIAFMSKLQTLRYYGSFNRAWI